MAAQQLITLLALLLAPNWAASTTATRTDAQLLLEFQSSFSNGEEVLQWNGTDPCVGWRGVTCNEDGDVTYLVVSSLGLIGSIPSPFGWQLPPKLRVVDLYDNNLRSSIPNNWTLPATLEEIYLAMNPLIGSVPESWILPDTLKTFYIGQGTQLSGTLPVKLALPPKLELLQLGGKGVGGSIPATWRFPETLTGFFAYESQLTGTIPLEWLEALPSGLERLWLFKNKLSGTVPKFKMPPALYSLTLSFNELSGTVPDFDFPEGYRWLDLGANNLTGTIPKLELPQSMNVDASDPEIGIGLYDNLLTGTLPAWASFPNASLFVSPGNPGLCGKVPNSPVYWWYDKENYTHKRLKLLPGCNQSVSSTAPAAPANDDSGSSTSTAAVAGAVVGAVAGLVLFGVLFWWFCWRKKRDQAAAIPADKKTAADVPGSHRSKLDQGSSQFDSWGTTTYGGSHTCNTGTGTGASRVSQDGLMEVAVSKDLVELSSSSSTKKLNVDVRMWVVPFQDLELKEPAIGRGSFGKVYLATWKGSQVAVKVLIDADYGSSSSLESGTAWSLSSPMLADLQQEAVIMAAVRHPNLLSFLGVCTSPPALVLEYCPRGALHEVLKQARASPVLAQELSWARRLEMALGTASGLMYLHSFSPALLHRDLKSANLLVASDWTIKVADFNLSRIFGEGSRSSAAVTNPRWLAPEVLAGQSHSFASDVFSLGVVLWELMTWQMPWENMSNPWQVVKGVMDGMRLPMPKAQDLPGVGEEFPALQAYTQLIQQCWAEDPDDRPSVADIITELRKLSMEANRPASSQGKEQPCDSSQERGPILRRFVCSSAKFVSPFSQAYTGNI